MIKNVVDQEIVNEAEIVDQDQDQRGVHQDQDHVKAVIEIGTAQKQQKSK